MNIVTKSFRSFSLVKSQIFHIGDTGSFASSCVETKNTFLDIRFKRTLLFFILLSACAFVVDCNTLATTSSFIVLRTASLSGTSKFTHSLFDANSYNSIIMSKRSRENSFTTSGIENASKKQKSLVSFFTSKQNQSMSAKGSAVQSMQSTTSSCTSSEKNKYHIFIDLDGVLVDFQAGLRSLFPNKYSKEKSHKQSSENTHVDDIPPRIMWSAISRTPTFFLDLPWTPDGLELWNTMKHYQPEILTGVPTNKESRKQKYKWCLREFNNFNYGNKVTVNHVDMAGGKFSHNLVNNGVRLQRKNDVVNVITCWSKNKHYESGHNR